MIHGSIFPRLLTILAVLFGLPWLSWGAEPPPLPEYVRVGLFVQQHPKSVAVSLPGGSSGVFKVKGGEASLEVSAKSKVSGAIFRNKVRSVSPKTLTGPDGVKRTFHGALETKVCNGELCLVLLVPLDDYTSGILARELHSGTAETLKAMAITVRTYILRNRALRHQGAPFDFCDSQHCQDFLSTRGAPDPVKKAVEATAGQVLLYKGEVAPVWYHANCGGHLSSPFQAWGQKTYLFRRTSEDQVNGQDLCKGAPSYRWHFTAGPNELRKLQEQEFPQAQYGDLLDLTVTKTFPSGHAAEVSLRGTLGEKTYDGETFRLKMQRLWGVNSIRSPHFHVKPKGSKIRFDGAGFGHGVGMCQYGALKLGTLGWTAERILQNYYPGTTLATLQPRDQSILPGEETLAETSPDIP